MRALVVPSLLLLFTACSGGGGNSATASSVQPGSVQVVVDTATGSDAFVQFQVVAATLETDSGSTTGNLVAQPKMLTLSDPMAQADGLVLSSVPTGSYTTLRLGFAPGSGVALYPSGTTVPVSTAFELVMTFAEPLVHDGNRLSFVVCGHYGPAPMNVATAAFSWTPMMQARDSGADVSLAALDVALVAAPELTVTDPRLLGAPMNVTFSQNCEFFDDSGNAYGSRDDFLRASSRGDDLRVEGRLHRSGRFDSDRVRRSDANRNPRLIGRITQLEPSTESFFMDAFAEARRGAHTMYSLPEKAVVRTANAHIEPSNSRQHLPFSALAVGNLVKVEWVSRTALANGTQEIVAREVEVSPAGGVAMQPEWEGRVDSVDLQARTITVVQRNNDPIIVNGQVQTLITVHVDTGVPIERRGNGGGGRSSIPLTEVVPGQDRIWWRGRVTAPTAIDTSWVRVRNQN